MYVRIFHKYQVMPQNHQDCLLRVILIFLIFHNGHFRSLSTVILRKKEIEFV